MIWETVSTCPKKSVVDSVVSMGAGVAVDVGGGGTCSRKLSPRAVVSTLHAALRGRLLWYEQNSGARRSLAALPELVDWRAREIYLGRGASLDCGHSTDGFYRLLRDRAHGGPVIASIDVAAYSYGKSCLDRRRVRNLYWAAFVAGSSGVGLSTIHTPVGRTVVLYEVRRVVADQLRQEAAHRRTLGSCLAGTKTVLRSSGGIRAAAYRSRRGTCVVAIDTALSGARMSLAVPGVRGSRITAVGEHRTTAKLDHGRLSDRFRRLGVHLYRF